ncbi:MAG: hypothetical protein IPN55_14060 [Saprospiraceae bacterium]|nr:hypothetical protein [Candidatus Brachybacter algidus]
MIAEAIDSPKSFTAKIMQSLTKTIVSSVQCAVLMVDSYNRKCKEITGKGSIKSHGRKWDAG